MRKPRNDSLFTLQEWLILLPLWALFAAVMFSMDPEWVGWAAPLVFGGALSAAELPPHLVFAASPQETFEVASFMSLFSLAALGLLALLRGELGLALFSRLRASLTGRLAHGIPSTLLRWRLHARVLFRAREDSSIGQETWERHPSASAQGRVTTASQRSRITPRDLRAGRSEDLQPLHGEAFSAGNNHLL